MANEINIHLGITTAETPGQHGIVAILESLDRTKIWNGTALVAKSGVARADWADGAGDGRIADRRFDARRIGLLRELDCVSGGAIIADPPNPLNIDLYYADDVAAFVAGGAVPAPVGFQAWPELPALLPASGPLARGPTCREKSEFERAKAESTRSHREHGAGFTKLLPKSVSVISVSPCCEQDSLHFFQGSNHVQIEHSRPARAAGRLRGRGDAFRAAGPHVVPRRAGLSAGQCGTGVPAPRPATIRATCPPAARRTSIPPSISPRYS